MALWSIPATLLWLLVMFISSGWLWVHDIYIKEKSENGALAKTVVFGLYRAFMCLFIYEYLHFTAHSSTCGVIVIPRCFFQFWHQNISGAELSTCTVFEK